MAPPSACVYMNIHELHKDVGRIVLARWMACCLADTLQVPRVSNHVGVTTMERLYQGHLHPKLEVPGLTCPGRDSNLGFLRGRRAL
jgi:hypothetical protein